MTGFDRRQDNEPFLIPPTARQREEYFGVDGHAVNPGLPMEVRRKASRSTNRSYGLPCLHYLTLSDLNGIEVEVDRGSTRAMA